MAKFFSAGKAWKPAHIVAAGQVLMDEGTSSSIIAAAINQIADQISLIAREFNGYTGTGGAKVLNEASISLSTAVQIFNDANLLFARGASILNDTNLALSRAVAILNDANLGVSRAAGILNDTNLGVSRAASILNDASISESRIISILGDSAITASRAASILADTNFTRTTLLWNSLWQSYKNKFNSIYDNLGYSATKFCYGFSTCGYNGSYLGTTERFDDATNTHAPRANATARNLLGGYSVPWKR
jgi:hypothetical protein